MGFRVSWMHNTHVNLQFGGNQRGARRPYDFVKYRGLVLYLDPCVIPNDTREMTVSHIGTWMVQIF